MTGRVLLRLTGVVMMTSRAGGDEPGHARDLWGREFVSTVVTEHDQVRPLVPGTRLRLAFHDGDVRAYAGCNHLTGRVRADGGRLAVDGFATTAMACDPARQEQDAWLASFLAAGPTWRLDGDDLVLGSGDTEIRLTDRSVAEPDRPLRGTRWVVDAVFGNQPATSVPAGVEAYLTFDDERVEGFTGCNHFGGTAIERDGQITFSDLAVTRMACSDEIMRLESAMLAVLDGTVDARIEGDRLTLTHPDGLGLRLRAA